MFRQFMNNKKRKPVGYTESAGSIYLNFNITQEEVSIFCIRANFLIKEILLMEGYEVPIWKKITLTVDEAVAYSGIGEGKIRSLLAEQGCPFALFIGNRRLVKREAFEKYLNGHYSI